MTTKLTAEYLIFHQPIPVIVPKAFAFKGELASLGSLQMHNSKRMAAHEAGAMEYEIRYTNQLADIVADGGFFHFQNPEKDAPMVYGWLHEALTRFINRKKNSLHTKDIPIELIDKLDLLAKFVYERAKAYIELGPLESGGAAKTSRFFANRNFDRFRKTVDMQQQETKARLDSEHVSVMDDLANIVSNRTFKGNRG